MGQETYSDPPALYVEAPVLDNTLDDEAFLNGLIGEREGEQSVTNTSELDPNDVIERLAAHYGSEQLFQYKQHAGTFYEMMSLCPAFKDIAALGFEAAIALFDRYKIDELSPSPVQDEKTSEQKTDDTKDGEGRDEKGHDAAEKVTSPDTGKKEAPLKQVAIAEKKVEKSDEVRKPEVNIQTDAKQEKKPTPAATKSLPKAQPRATRSRAAKKSSAEPAAVKPAEKKAQPPKEKELVAVKKKVEKSAADVQPVVTADTITPAKVTPDGMLQVRSPRASAEVALEVPRVEVRRIKTPMPKPEKKTVVAVSQPEVAPLPPKRRGFLTMTETVDVQEAPLVSRADVVPKEEAVVMAVEVPASIETAELSKPAGIEKTTSSYLETWAPLAERAAPLDTLFWSMAKHLEDEMQSSAEEPPVREEQAYLSPEHTALLEAITATITPERVAPEVYALLLAVSSAKETVERLYTARTKEACADYVEQLIVELSVILRELGYENPEVIVRDYLHSHSPESIKRLIERLERALRQRLQYELGVATARAQKAVTSRTQRLARFVTHVLTALNLTPAPQSAATQ